MIDKKVLLAAQAKLEAVKREQNEREQELLEQQEQKAKEYLYRFLSKKFINALPNKQFLIPANIDFSSACVVFDLNCEAPVLQGLIEWNSSGVTRLALPIPESSFSNKYSCNPHLTWEETIVIEIARWQQLRKKEKEAKQIEAVIKEIKSSQRFFETLDTLNNNILSWRSYKVDREIAKIEKDKEYQAWREQDREIRSIVKSQIQPKTIVSCYKWIWFCGGILDKSTKKVIADYSEAFSLSDKLDKNGWLITIDDRKIKLKDFNYPIVEEVWLNLDFVQGCRDNRDNLAPGYLTKTQSVILQNVKRINDEKFSTELYVYAKDFTATHYFNRFVKALDPQTYPDTITV